MDLTDLATKIARLEENQTTTFKRMDKLEAGLVQIHQIAASIDNLASEVRCTNNRMEKVIDSFDERMEKNASMFEERLKQQGERVGELENKGGKKLEAIILAFITAVIAALVFYFTGQGV